jgi:DNA primase
VSIAGEHAAKPLTADTPANRVGTGAADSSASSSKGDIRCLYRPTADGHVVAINTERLRHEHPIVEVVSSYGIQLRRSGTTFVGRCPFHADQGRPNLTLFERSSRFVCFRCDARGATIAFVQQMEGIGFREAVERLGGPTMRQYSPACRPRRTPSPRPPARDVLDRDELEVIAAAVELYRNRLLADDDALTYLYDRGLRRETIERAHLGLASGQDLVRYLGWRRLPIEAAIRGGLLTTRGEERLRGRLIVPEIRDGQPVWMIGRTLASDAEVPKYVGLPGAIPLLGWETAAHDLRGVCLVEGPFDMLTLHQWGVPCLALCGTGSSHATIEALSRWERIYAVFDTDTAGLEATARLQRVLGERVVAVTLPADVKDPSDLACRPDGETVFRGAIVRAVELAARSRA